MPNFKTVSQKKFAKGLNAATGVLSQQPATVTRISNLSLNQRGSLQTCDGSAVIAQLPAGVTSIYELGYFNALNPASFPFYLALAANPADMLTGPEISIVSPVAGSGNAAGTYFFMIVGYDSSGNHTGGTFFALVTAATFSGIFFEWTVGSPGLTGYKIYYAGTSESFQGVLLATIVGSGSTSYTFTGTLPTTPLVNLPFGNTTLQTDLYLGTVTPGSGQNYPTFVQIAGVSYDGPSLQPALSVPGDPNFTADAVVPGFSPYGGIAGLLMPIPQILQFAQLSILILGNGVPPQSFNPSTPATPPTSLTNTFVANYPPWQASVDWAQGSQIYANVGGVNYLFTAVQGGVSGTTMPTFPSALGATVTDNSGSSSTTAQSIIWQNGGQVSSSPAPRGAAHGIVYAGSLWLLNTSPQTTSDNESGPTVLMMSDTNNPSSWNPINVAFIGRDDGTQGTGLATFTVAEIGVSPIGSLVVFKEFSTYQIIGVFGASDFAITQAQTDMGCLAARTIQFIPGFGIARLAHLGFAVFDGERDRLISEEIRPYLFGGVDSQADIVPIDWNYAYFSKAAQVNQPPMYVVACPLVGASGQLTRLFCYDLVMKAWTIIDLPWPIGVLRQIRVGDQKPLLLAARSDATGLIERIQAGDLEWDSTVIPPVTPAPTASPIAWNFQTPDVFGEGSSARVFYRRVTIRGYAISTPQTAQAGVTSAVQITVTASLDGIPSTVYEGYVQPQPASSQFQLDIDIMRTAQIVHLNVSGTGRCVIDSLDWKIVERPGGELVIG